MNDCERLARVEVGWVPGVAKQPVMQLAYWTMFEVDDGRRHLLGWNLLHKEGR